MPAGIIWAPGEGLGSCPELIHISIYLYGSAIIRSIFETTTIQNIHHGCSTQTRLSRWSGGPASETKTFREDCRLYANYSLAALSGDSRISYPARSSSRSKCYNAPTSMRIVMDSERYLCIMIPTIKRCDPGSYEEIPTSKS